MEIELTNEATGEVVGSFELSDESWAYVESLANALEKDPSEVLRELVVRYLEGYRDGAEETNA